MRSSKSRSRSKSNRNRPSGNVVNRVFDSSGPEGKVRGTPQQIIDKYNQLARDAHLSNDRVAAENFQQHAEHYTRMLSEAQREQEARREAQERQQAERQQNDRQQNDRQQADRQQTDLQQSDRQQSDRQERPQSDRQPEPARESAGEERRPNGATAAQPVEAQDASETAFDVAGGEDTEGGGLVETPENANPRPRRSRGRRSQGSAQNNGQGGETTDGAAEAAE